LMNTPSFNSRVTAQRVFQALLRSAPNLPVAELHRRVTAGEFDTGRHLKNYPTEKLEGKRIAILGFGNVGREVAKMAKAFSMDVVIYARADAEAWCQSEGYRYAPTPAEAARDAHFLTIHTGLGTEANGRFANEGLVDFAVLSQLNEGAVVINYDRGELIDAPSLGNALADGRVRFVCVDADIFVDPEGNSSGPMAPYLRLSREFHNAFELLPHAAADTDHVSRVEGAKQAVEQIIRSIRYKELVNVKGEVPDGYARVGVCTVRGVGNIGVDRLQSAASDRQQVMELRSLSEKLAAFWKAVSTTDSPERRAELIRNYGSRLVGDSNRYASTMEALGLRGPLF
jgi:lactate dehydrogenase-like 2-hydroxyacid dehydrogenase